MKLPLLLFTVVVGIGVWRWILWADTVPDAQQAVVVLPTSSAILPASSVLPFRRPSPTPRSSVLVQPIVLTRSVFFDVPFIPQAPIGNWEDPVYQNACEEASIVMAMRWVEGKSLTTEEAMTEIQALSDYAWENYGHFHDLSAADTARLMRDYYDYFGVTVERDIVAADIRRALAQGKLVIVPVNGRKLPNPFYTSPGPLEHMLVIKGYDLATEEFITNDPGTKRGQDFRYKSDVLEAALRDYPTGFHLPITAASKAMIVVEAAS